MIRLEHLHAPILRPLTLCGRSEGEAPGSPPMMGDTDADARPDCAVDCPECKQALKDQRPQTVSREHLAASVSDTGAALEATGSYLRTVALVHGGVLAPEVLRNVGDELTVTLWAIRRTLELAGALNAGVRAAEKAELECTLPGTGVPFASAEWWRRGTFASGGYVGVRRRAEWDPSED